MGLVFSAADGAGLAILLGEEDRFEAVGDSLISYFV